MDGGLCKEDRVTLKDDFDDIGSHVGCVAHMDRSTDSVGGEEERSWV